MYLSHFDYSIFLPSTLNMRLPNVILSLFPGYITYAFVPNCNHSPRFAVGVRQQVSMQKVMSDSFSHALCTCEYESYVVHTYVLVIALLFKSYDVALHGFVQTFSFLLIGKVSSMSLLASSLSGKNFQLEELEDKESCITDVFMKEDYTLVVGETDGPRPVEASGTWEESPDGTVKVVLERTFSAGKSSSDPTGMGEFQFTVSRTFSGEITSIGANLAVAGKIICEEVGDVGYFNLIDTSNELPDKKAGESMTS